MTRESNPVTRKEVKDISDGYERDYIKDGDPADWESWKFWYGYFVDYYL